MTRRDQQERSAISALVSQIEVAGSVVQIGAILATLPTALRDSLLVSVRSLVLDIVGQHISELNADEMSRFALHMNPFAMMPDTLTTQIVSHLSLEDKMKSICRVSTTFNDTAYRSLSRPYADPWDINIVLRGNVRYDVYDTILDDDIICISGNTIKVAFRSHPDFSGVFCASKSVSVSTIMYMPHNSITPDWRLMKYGHMKRLTDEYGDGEDSVSLDVISHIEVIENVYEDSWSDMFNDAPNLRVIHSLNCSAEYLIDQMINADKMSSQIQMICFARPFMSQFRQESDPNILDHTYVCLFSWGFTFLNNSFFTRSEYMS